MSFPGGSDSKESTCNAGDLGSIPGSERSPGVGSITHCSILTWRIPWTEQPGRPQSMGPQRVCFSLRFPKLIFLKEAEITVLLTFHKFPLLFLEKKK